MGYYLPPKSYLKPKQRVNVRQKTLVISLTGIGIFATGILIIAMQFGHSKSAAANSKTEKKSGEIEMPVVLMNPSPSATEGKPQINPNFPVELAYFKADVNPHAIELKWSTMYEYKNDFFTLEKSINGTDFTEIGCIDSKKSSELSSDYAFIDDSLCDGIVFYRLQQTSENGNKTFIALEKVARKKDMQDQPLYIERVGPEPFDKFFNINYYTDKEGGVAVELFNKEGRKIYKCYTNANQGYNTCKFIDGDKLTDDVYTLRIVNSNGACVQRIRKKI